MRRTILPLLAAAAGAAAALVLAPPAQATCGEGQGTLNADARVQLWADPRCTGGAVAVAQEPEDDRPNFTRFRGGRSGSIYDVDNSRSSVAVAKNYCARLFDAVNYRGEDSSLICARDATEYRNLGALDNRGSSMKVCGITETSGCDGAPPPPPSPTPTPPPAPPVPNGANASAAARLSVLFPTGKTSRTINYGSDTSARMTLTNEAGAPISGARLQLFERELRTGTDQILRGEVTTGPDGTATAELPPGTSRSLEVQYRSTDQDPAPVVTDSVRLGVRAGVTINLSPRSLRAGRSVRISGTVRGTPRPSRGKLVVVQAYERGRWRTFETARASAGTGRYAVRYRFSSRARGSFKMRAQVRVDSAYPYSLGYSSERRVRVRG